MFTGIIQVLGKIASIAKVPGAIKLLVEADFKAEQPKIGDSIAINGACMTVEKFEKNKYTFHVSQESLDRTSLGSLKINDSVNLEQSLMIGQRVDGHFVTGHVDALGKVEKIEKSGTNYLITFSYPSVLGAQLVDKGSVSIDGISLTVIKPTGNTFQVTIVPHTLENTVLKSKVVGNPVNLETDVLAKYVSGCVGAKNELTKGFLSKAGF